MGVYIYTGGALMRLATSLILELPPRLERARCLQDIF